MSTASSGRRPLGEVSESYLNSPKREFHKGLGSKTAIKTDKKSSSAAKISIEIDKDESLKKKGPEPSSRSSKSVTKPGSTVEVTFPVGSMGLDLEPLISSVSPERLIGCRIKDFYFGIDHSGIDERALRAVVAPGHIVASIDGEEVLFAQFMDILNKLRQLKLKERKICFKALSTEETGSLHGVRSPSANTLVFSPDRETAAGEICRPGTPSRSQRIDVSLLTPSVGSIGATPSVRTAPAAVKAQPASAAKAESVNKSAQLFLSPRAVKMISKRQDEIIPTSNAPPSPQKVIQSFIAASTDDQSLSERSARKGVCSSQPKAVAMDYSRADDLSVCSLHSYCSDRDDDSTMLSTVTDAPKAILGSEFSHNLVNVGAAIGQRVVSAAAVVSHSAEHIVGAALPFYSSSQMEDAVAKKHTLLQELSRTCMLLGLSEQRQSTLESQLQRLSAAEQRAEESRRQTEDRYRQACSRFESTSMELAAVQADRDAWSARAHAAETEIAVLRGAVRTSEDKITVLSSELEIVKSQSSSYVESINHLEQAVIDAKQGTRLMQQTLGVVRIELEEQRALHENDLKSWQAQFDRMEEEQRHLKEELEATLLEASDRFAALEGEKDVIEQLRRELLESMGKTQAAHKDEIQKLRDSMMAQQEWQRERLNEKDAQLVSLGASIADYSNREIETVARMAADGQEIQQLQERVSAGESELAIASHVTKTLEAKVHSLAEEKDALLQKMGKLQSEVAHKSTAVDELSSQVDLLEKQRKAIAEDLNEVSKQKLFVDQKSASMAKQIAAARDEASASTDSWKQVVALLKVQLEEKEQEMSLAIFKANLDAKICHETLESDMKSQISQLQDSNRELVEKVEECKNIIEELRREAGEVRDKNDQISADAFRSLSMQQRHNAELEKNLISRTAEVHALSAKIASAEDQVTDIQMHLNRSDDKAAVMSSELDARNSEINSWREKFAALMEEFLGVKQRNVDLVSLNDQLERARVELCERFEDEQLENIAKLRSEIELSLYDVAELTEMVKKEKVCSSSLDSAVKERDATIEVLEERLRSEVSQYQMQLNTHLSGTKSLESTVNRQNNQIDELNIVISKQGGELLMLREALHLKTSDLELLRDRVVAFEQLQEERTTVEDLLQESQNMVSAQTKREIELTVMIEELQSSVAILQSSFTASNATNMRLDEDIDALQTKCTNFEIENLALQAVEKELSASLLESTVRSDSLAGELQTEVDAHNLLKSTISSEQRTHSASLAELEATKLSLVVLSEEVVALKDTLAAVQSTLSYRQEMIVGRDLEINQLKRLISTLQDDQAERDAHLMSNDNMTRRQLYELCLVICSLHDKLSEFGQMTAVNTSVSGDCIASETFLDDSISLQTLLPVLESRMREFYLVISQLGESLFEKQEELISMELHVQTVDEASVNQKRLLREELDRLQQECVHKDIRITRLSESIDILTQNCSALTADLDIEKSLGAQNLIYQRQHITKLVAAFSTIKDDLTKTKVESRSIIDYTVHTVMNSFQQSMEQLQKRITCAEYNEKNAQQELKTYKEHAISQNAELLARLTEYDGAVDTLESENSSLYRQIAEYKSEMSKLSVGRDESLGDRYALQELRTEYNIAMDSMKLLKRDATQAKGELELVQEQERNLMNDYREASKSFKSERFEFENKIKTLAVAVKSLNNENLALRTKLVSLQRSAEDATEAISAALEKRIAEMTAERDVALDCLQMMRFEAKQREAAIRDELDHALEGCRVDRALLVQSIESKIESSVNGEPSGAIDVFGDKPAKRTDELTSMQAVLAFLKQKVRLVEEERDVEANKYQKLLHKFEDVEESLKKDLDLGLEGYRVDRSLLVGRYEEQLRVLSSRKDIEIARLAADMEEMSAAMTTIAQDRDHTEMDALQRSYRQLQLEHIRDIEHQKEVANALAKNVEDLRAVIESLKSDIECDRVEYEKTSLDWKHEKSELNRLISALRSEASNMSNLKFSVEEDLACTTVHLATLQQQSEDASSRISELEDELNTANMRSRRSIAESAKTKKELDMTLTELQRMTEAHDNAKAAHEKINCQFQEIVTKHRRMEESYLLINCRSSDSEVIITTLRESLDSALAENDVLKSELAANKQNANAVASELVSTKIFVESKAHELESIKTQLITTESKLLVALSASKEFSSDVESLKNWSVEKSLLQEKISSLSSLVKDQQRALDTAAAHDAESASNRAMFQKIAVDADAQAKRFGDQVVELSRLLASNQGEILHLRSQLKEKRNELKAMNDAVASMLMGDVSPVDERNKPMISDTVDERNKPMISDTSVRSKTNMHVNNEIKLPTLQQQMLWRDELWTQALDIQSAMAEIATDIDSFAPAIEQFNNPRQEDAYVASPLSPTDGNGSPPGRSTRMKAAAAAKKSAKHKSAPKIPSSQSLGVRIQFIMEQLHNFQAVLLSPPWNDVTVQEATSEIISGHIVELKPARGRRAFGTNINSLVLKALIRMLLKVIRARGPKIIDVIPATRILTGPTKALPLHSDCKLMSSEFKYFNEFGRNRLNNNDAMNESHSSSIWNVSDESENGAEYSLEDLYIIEK